jgi:hypothetical protein
MARRLADDAIAREQTEDVLRTEALTIHETNLSDRKGPELYRALNRLDSAALCLSGGGIRSAAFCLGVIQRSHRIRVPDPSAKTNPAHHALRRTSAC